MMICLAVDNAFGSEIDYGMLNKLYGQEPEREKRYSPAKCIGAEKQVIQGNPDQKLISTSYVERQNLTMRMSMRRFTRLTNAFSKKVENLEHAVALHFMYYITLLGRIRRWLIRIREHQLWRRELVNISGRSMI